MNNSAYALAGVQRHPSVAPVATDEDSWVALMRQELMVLSQTPPPSIDSTQRLLTALSEQLIALKVRGWSLQEICRAVETGGLAITVHDLARHFDQQQTRRLTQCEQELARNRCLPWSQPTARASFIESGLREALKSGQGLVLYYQPQVDTLTGKVIGAEALVRWRVEGALLLPAEFIPVAESSELIVSLGQWILREACTEAKRWKTMGLGGAAGIKVGVNLSVKQFTPGLTDMVHSVLCDVDLATNLLGLEITESAILHADSLAVLHKLSRSGMHLSIDDFGTGYSSLSHLRDMPLNTVKIDQSFVRSLGSSEVPTLVLESIIQLAHKLKMDTLAEGVETLEQAQALQRLGCSVCQGFFYAEPLPAEAFIEFVNR